MKAKTAAISMALWLLGCASITGPSTLPDDWGSVRSIPTSDGCPELAGTYSNQSAGTFPAPLKQPSNFSDILSRMAPGQGAWSRGDVSRAWPKIPGDVTSVSIEQKPETLRMIFANSQGDRTSLDFRRYHFSWSEERYDDLFTCYLAADEPRLRFLAEPESHGGASPISFEGGGTLVMLLKAVDDSLIVQWRSESILFWIGVVGSEFKVDSVWFRFPSLRRPGPDLP